MISIIIPAHNESAVIGRLLTALTTDARPGELDIVVVCNGCTDDTAEISRRYGPFVRVLESAVASKQKALNCGDQAALSFPRFYVDADVVISSAAIRNLAMRLEPGDILVVAPRAEFCTTNSSLSVRMYFNFRRWLPSAAEGIGGSGVYGMSKVGRGRFAEFPDVTADDGYVRVQFSTEERETLEDVRSLVLAPRTLRSLIAIKSRSYLGSYQLAKRYPALWRNRGTRNHETILRLTALPWLWPGLLIYSSVAILAKRQARKRLAANEFTWERDNTSRSRVLRMGENER